MLEIRPYQSQDRAALLQLIVELQAHEYAIDPARTEPTLDYAEKYFALLWKEIEENQGILWVATWNHAACGFISGIVDEAVSRPHYFYVNDLAVSPAYRGQGIGTQLMNAVEDYARAQGFKRLDVGVLVGNDGAYALYKRLGFRDYVVELTKDL
jgi:ribosomal protein S18 acetylase RimI-like enzyme